MVEAVTRPTADFSKAEQYEAMSGGAATSTAKVDADSFSHFSENLTFQQEEGFKLGNALFRKVWVSSPSSTFSSDGLGPLFNARGCQNCHLKDGRRKVEAEDAKAATGEAYRVKRGSAADIDEAAARRCVDALE